MNGSTDNQSATSPRSSFYDEMRRENAGNPAILANIDHLERVETRAEREMPTIIPPCPAWCGEPAGHIYGYRDDPEDEPITYVRTHFSDPEGVATLAQEERNREGVVELDLVTVHLDLSTRDIGPADLRRYAAALLDLADKFEQVTS